LRYATSPKQLLGVLAVATMMAGAGAVGSAHGETVLITGSNRGLGLGFARAYGDRGWDVIATVRNPEDAADLEALKAKNKKIVIEKLDVADEASINALAAKYKDRPIDLLIHNAAINDADGTGATLGTLDARLFEREMRTNVLGPLLISQAFLPNVEASTLKKIVAITSPSAVLGRPMNKETRRAHTYFYRPSKSALNMAMKILAAEVRERGVIVGIVHPGGVDTQMLRSVFGGKPQPQAQRPDEAAVRVVGVIDTLNKDNMDQVWGYDGKVIPW
jgi:NAD(P)-dependent dehydrogenase (short-subunit alcohol dehydrogenase family)